MLLVDLFATLAESENVLRCFFIFGESSYLCLLKAIHDSCWKAFPGRDLSHFWLNYQRWWVGISRIESMDGIFTSFSSQIAQPARNLFSSRDNCRIVWELKLNIPVFQYSFQDEAFWPSEIFAKNNWSWTTNETGKWHVQENSHDFLSCSLSAELPDGRRIRKTAGRSNETSNDINWNFFVLDFNVSSSFCLLWSAFNTLKLMRVNREIWSPDH